MSYSSAAIAATYQWLHEAVIELNLCPFAKPVLAQNALRTIDCNAATIGDTLVTVENELTRLQTTPSIATTLIVLPHGFTDFHDFLGLVEEAEITIERLGLDYDFQLASFHPDYLFAGEPANSPSHFTNRSPYPILHLLRAADVEQAIANLTHPERIYENNIKRVNGLGAEYFKMLLERCKQS